MGNGFEINTQAIAEMTRRIQQEFDRNRIRVPIEGDSSHLGVQPAATVNNYHGPVVTVSGDNAQIAWGNDAVKQNQNHSDQIAPGYEPLAQLLTNILANIESFTLGDDDVADLRAEAQGMLTEIVKEDPDRSILRRGVNILKGLFAPIATGVSAGVSSASTDAARSMIEQLGTSLSF